MGTIASVELPSTASVEAIPLTQVVAFTQHVIHAHSRIWQTAVNKDARDQSQIKFHTYAAMLRSLAALRDPIYMNETRKSIYQEFFWVHNQLESIQTKQYLT